jgi:hypothetical protein
MIQITPQMRVVAAVEPVDFRRGIDGLARLCNEAITQYPLQQPTLAGRSRGHRSSSSAVRP